MVWIKWYSDLSRDLVLLYFVKIRGHVTKLSLFLQIRVKMLKNKLKVLIRNLNSNFKAKNLPSAKFLTVAVFVGPPRPMPESIMSMVFLIHSCLLFRALLAITAVRWSFFSISRSLSCNMARYSNESPLLRVWRRSLATVCTNAF